MNLIRFNKIIYSWYGKCIGLLGIVNFKIALQVHYFLKMRKKMNLKNPMDFNEKINWLKLFYDKSNWEVYADKYKVRDFVESKGLGELLIPLHAVYESANEIDLSKLPEKFVMKTNNASATNIIQNGYNKLDESKIKEQMSKWLMLDFGRDHLEPHYSKMKPVIIVEELIETKDGSLPPDYKIFVFGGKAHYIYTIANRDKQFHVHGQGIFDTEWNFISGKLTKYEIDKDIPKPEKLKEMIHYAEILADDMPFCRVDFYEQNKKVLFGEMTFTPNNGTIQYFNQDFLNELGELLILPNV